MENKTIIGLLEKIADSVGIDTASNDGNVPLDVYADKQGREEILIRYTIGEGEFGLDNDGVPLIALHCAMFKMNGERDGTFEGVLRQQTDPAKLLQRPEQPKPPLNAPKGPFPQISIGAITKAIWTFGDGSAVTGIGPAYLQLVKFTDDSQLFLVSVASAISNGTGKYKNARGIKTGLGATFIPRGVDMFNLPPGQKFAGMAVETFRIIRAEYQG